MDGSGADTFPAGAWLWCRPGRHSGASCTLIKPNLDEEFSKLLPTAGVVTGTRLAAAFVSQFLLTLTVGVLMSAFKAQCRLSSWVTVSSLSHHSHPLVSGSQRCWLFFSLILCKQDSGVMCLPCTTAWCAWTRLSHLLCTLCWSTDT